MTKRKTVVLTHGEDVDGIISAALAKKFFKGEIDVRLVRHSNQLEVFQKLSSENLSDDTNIYIFDLMPKKNLFMATDDQISVMDSLCFKTESVVWIDHHDDFLTWELEKRGVRYIGGEKKKECAALLIWNELISTEFPEEAIEKIDGFLLATIAQVNDYPGEEKMTGIIARSGDRIQQAISCLNYFSREEDLQKLINLIALGENWMAFVNSVLAECEWHIMRARSYLARNQKVLQIGGFDFLLATVDPILPQKQLLRKMRSEHAGKVDGCVVFFSDPANNVLFFSDPVRCSFSAQKFCTYMGGGGRDGDGGFSAKFLDFSDFLSFFEQKMTKYLNP